MCYRIVNVKFSNSAGMQCLLFVPMGANQPMTAGACAKSKAPPETVTPGR